ncbi:polysaccharide biosynthesis protein [Rhodobacter capsulatus]|uniref:polysaccharide biosynthesis protein n=1 Tax=Rhodobacter capsulatus TaxID=1061 RepID=UPI004026E7C5
MLLKSIISLSRRQKSSILVAVDMLLVPLSFCLALALLNEGSALLPLIRSHALELPLLVVVAGALSSLMGLTRIKLRDYQGEAVMRSALLAAVLTMGSAVQSTLAAVDQSPGLHVVFGLLYFTVFFFTRLALTRLLIAIYRNSRTLSRVAIYGAGRTGMALARELRNSDDFVVCAFLDDNATLAGMTMNGVPIHSGVHAARVIDQYKVNRVILAMPSVSTDKQTFLSQRLEKLGLQVHSLPAFTQIHGGKELLDLLRPIGTAALLSRDPLSHELTAGRNAYRDANVLISGAGGSIGLELCRQVVGCRPKKLVLYELSELALYNAEAEMRVLAETTGVEIVPVLGSVADRVQVAQVLEQHRIEIVLHAAAYKHVPLVELNARAGMANNVLGTAVLARAAREAQVRRFVLVSSDKAVRPGNLMGASKRLAELIVQDLAARPGKTVFSIVRFGNVLGSSGSVVPLFQEQIARGGPVTLTDARVTRFFMTIQEASRLVLLAGSFAEGGEVFVLDMGKPVKIGDLARRLIETAGFTVRDAANPEGDIEIVTTGLRPGEKLHEELMVRKGAQTTAHPKIISVREDHLSELATAAALRDLREAIDRGSDAEVIAVVARAVPEYAPQSLPASALQCQVVQAQRNAQATDLPAE